MEDVMKSTVFALVVLLTFSTYGWAHMTAGGMMGEPEQAEDQGGYPVARGGYGMGYGMGPGMMGGYGMGYGMGPGMMGGYGMGYGMGPGMMGGYGPGYGMGPGMMGGYGPGYGMGPGMMGGYAPQTQKFLDETRDLRKEIHNKQFEYAEAQRDPKTTPETLWLLEKELRELTGKLSEKMYEYQRPR